MARKHLSTREHIPFNTLSKTQEKEFIDALNEVWEEVQNQYSDVQFENLHSIGLKQALDIDFILQYLNRARKKHALPTLTRKDIEAERTNAKGLKPDGGVWFIRSKIDNEPIIFLVVEVKHQGLYTGYTPISYTDWKNRTGEVRDEKNERPPQAQGNAIERFAKNMNAFRTLNALYQFNPYIIFCDGFDFFMKEEYKLFQHQKYAERYKDIDSSIRMRLIAGNEFKPLNTIYISGENLGNTKIFPATIMARMQQWKKHEIKDILHQCIQKSLQHLKDMKEI